ncbi:MAG: WD40/YVTN/BNR-like repeat-containing protein [Sandaracinaceae bacterium]
MPHFIKTMPDVDEDAHEVRDADDDGGEIELPPLRPLTVDEDGEALGVEDGLSDASLIDTGPDESIDLDDSTGTLDDQALFKLELPPDDASEPDDGASDSDMLTIDSLEGDEEYGYVDEENAEDAAWEDGADLPDLVPLGHDDGGEEGVEDVVDLGVEGDDDVSHLPPLSLEEDGELDEAEDLLGEAEIRAMLRHGEDDLLAPEVSPDEPKTTTAEEPGDVRIDVAHLGPRDDDIRCVSLPPRLAGGTGLYAVGPTCRPSGLAEHRVLSIALDHPTVLVGTAFEGLHRSADGEAFSRVDGWPEGAAHVVRENGASRFWARSESGGLYRSVDDGVSWTGPLLLKPVVGLAAPASGGIVVLCAGRDAPTQVARSDDGGERWGAVDGPPVGPGLPGPEWSLAVLGDVIAVAADSDTVRVWVSGDRGRSWAASPHPTGGTTALALVDEAGAPTLYVASEDDGSSMVQRIREAPEAERVVLNVAAHAREQSIEPRGDGDGEARVHALAATQIATTTVLWVATGVGLFRVDVEWGEGA